MKKKEIAQALIDLLEYVERQICLHEETYRGGAIWEICSSCGMKWADEEGGKPDDTHEWPKEIAAAQKIVDKLKIK